MCYFMIGKLCEQSTVIYVLYRLKHLHNPPRGISFVEQLYTYSFLQIDKQPIMWQCHVNWVETVAIAVKGLIRGRQTDPKGFGKNVVKNSERKFLTDSNTTHQILQTQVKGFS